MTNFLESSLESRDLFIFSPTVGQSNMQTLSQQFDAAQSWPDLISWLTKLDKSNIELNLELNKRISQCLHSRLPQGVHLKAIQVLKSKKFSASCFSFILAFYAISNLKSNSTCLLIPTKFNLVPITAASISALDQENILSDLHSSSFFNFALYKVIISYPSQRLNALLHLTSLVNNCSSHEDLFSFYHPFITSALLLSLLDVNILVNRSALDLLSTKFSIKSGFFTNTDFLKIVDGVFRVVLKKDMGLNRRVFSFLDGVELKDAFQVCF